MSTTTTTMTLTQRLETQIDTDGLARLRALQNTVSLANLIPPTVSFESSGLTLVVGNAAQIASFVAAAPDAIKDRMVLLCNDGSEAQGALPLYYASDMNIEGFLGAFQVSVPAKLSVSDASRENLAQIASGRQHFDLVVDLTEGGIHTAELPPLGYYAVGRGLASEEEALEAAAETIGTFDKPKFFKLDNNRCAHTRSGLDGCTRCIDACPADALSVVNKAITINPYLCQGMGSCATACPTEAISYALPEPDTTQHFVFDLLMHYREQGGKAPVVLFYADSDETALSDALAQLPSRVIPVRLEELASVGAEIWLCALAYGATQVVLAKTPQLHSKTLAVLEQELVVVSALLGDIGIDASRVTLVDMAALPSLPLASEPLLTLEEKLTGSKRDKLCAALDALAAAAQAAPSISAVPQGAPYGLVSIKTDDCTLCMSCVAVCPTTAMQAVGNSPGVTFREQDCVQCGLCESACPESVISLEPRFNWDTTARQTRTVLHQEAAAECISCGKPFAPASMVNMLIEKLRGHSHFQEDAIKRLSMCEDCRVRDIVAETMINDPHKQLKV
ncbi:4Fe-4S dicluster domain-containing protein [Enterovibrio paralichthyis]|uniref:4Fe-4S dicluster domain-containing protein n=1 Tax=Enterovibrio paralichthyis TaxID=2853805 RepID=UPI001C46CC40|nr:4Fe-4S dicluster domain-containing protein [Enterovibrio paralichthyis]MBV7299526.1 4Fe-4S binding protein [Enterovibrio paralichthyis]